MRPEGGWPRRLPSRREAGPARTFMCGSPRAAPWGSRRWSHLQDEGSLCQDAACPAFLRAGVLSHSQHFAFMHRPRLAKSIRATASEVLRFCISSHWNSPSCESQGRGSCSLPWRSNNPIPWCLKALDSKAMFKSKAHSNALFIYFFREALLSFKMLSFWILIMHFCWLWVFFARELFYILKECDFTMSTQFSWRLYNSCWGAALPVFCSLCVVPIHLYVALLSGWMFLKRNKN